MTSPYPTYRDVAGLRIPIQLVPRIVRAFRATYPQLVEGLDDDAATRAVLKNFVLSTVSVYESQQAAQVVQLEIAARQASLGDVASAAFEKAKTDLGVIADAPVVGVNGGTLGGEPNTLTIEEGT